MDSAFFDDRSLSFYNEHDVEFSSSLPFEGFPQLERTIEERRYWHRIDEALS